MIDVIETLAYPIEIIDGPSEYDGPLDRQTPPSSAASESAAAIPIATNTATTAAADSTPVPKAAKVNVENTVPSGRVQLPRLGFRGLAARPASAVAMPLLSPLPAAPAPAVPTAPSLEGEGASEGAAGVDPTLTSNGATSTANKPAKPKRGGRTGLADPKPPKRARLTPPKAASGKPASTATTAEEPVAEEHAAAETATADDSIMTELAVDSVDKSAEQTATVTQVRPMPAAPEHCARILALSRPHSLPVLHSTLTLTPCSKCRCSPIPSTRCCPTRAPCSLRASRWPTTSPTKTPGMWARSSTWQA